MATTIRSTALDFDNIKNNLKKFLANKEEFQDYNFETSGLSNLLDVLAYNTHMNSLIANFALNESFLSTAQLRSSVVSLAEGIGYIPRSKTAAKASVKISFNTNAAGAPGSVTLPKFTRFNADVDGVSYVFQTIDNFTASDNGAGFYEFNGLDGSTSIDLFEGTFRTKTFYVGEYADNPVYIIPDTQLDTSTVSVEVYPDASSTEEVPYINITKASKIDDNTAVYILKESPNGFFELSFGDGETFGISPKAGNRIVVNYLASSGETANNASRFDPQINFVSGTINTTLKVVTQTISTGGGESETIESIRKNAPFQYASQNRMVTNEDYSALILKNFSNYISDISSWGGEDNLDPEFGAVYVSIVFDDDVSRAIQRSIKTSIIELANQLQVISFRIRFVEPEITFIQLETAFQYNPNQTSLSKNGLRTEAAAKIAEYFTNNTGKFNEAFRRSPVLTIVDDVDPSILSSRQTVKMQKRFVPTAPTLIRTINNDITDILALPDDLMTKVVIAVSKNKYNDAANLIYNTGLSTYSSLSFNAISTALTAVDNNTSTTLRYPNSIAVPDDDVHIVTSSIFTFSGQTCTIKNKFSSNTLQIIADNGNVLVDNIGSFTNDTITINYFNPTALVGNVNYIKISVLPANQSAVVPTRNNIIQYDEGASLINAISTSAEN